MQQYTFVLNIAVVIVNLLMMVSVGLSLEREQFRALTRRKTAILGLLISQICQSRYGAFGHGECRDVQIQVSAGSTGKYKFAKVWRRSRKRKSAVSVDLIVRGVKTIEIQSELVSEMSKISTHED